MSCVRRRRKFIGVEREPTYFESALNSISNELKRPRFDFCDPRENDELKPDCAKRDR